MFFCSSCGLKTNDSKQLIPTKKKSCSKCGRSSFKCPRCGMYVKEKKNQKINVIRSFSPTAQKVVSGYQEKVLKTGRNVRINKN